MIGGVEVSAEDKIDFFFSLSIDIKIENEPN